MNSGSMLGRQLNSVKSLGIWPYDVVGGHYRIGRCEDVVQIVPDSLIQIGFELHLVILSHRCTPRHCEHSVRFLHR